MTLQPPSRTVIALVGAYGPTHVRKSVWDVVADCVREAALAVAATPATAAKVLPVLAGYAAWLHNEGLVVEQRHLGDLDLVERYVQVGMTGCAESTRATRRASLRRIASRLDVNKLARPEPIAYRRVKPPYAAWEIARYFELAANQPTASRRRTVRAVLALGLGCGLDRPDLAWVRGIDVAAGHSSVTIKVIGGPRARSVIALEDYADMIADCAQAAGDRLLIGGQTLGRHNVATPVLDRMVTDASLPRILPARLRSTWLVHHLDARRASR